MAKAENKTKPTDVAPEDFLKTIENPRRQADAFRLLELFRKATGLPARMWGPAIIGFGRHHYKYDSGREGEMLLAGFSPRKQNLTLYIKSGYNSLDDPDAELGKHKSSKACVYINKLEDVDLSVLERIVAKQIEIMRDRVEAFDE